MSRPGFVLQVDERTPPLLVHQGEGFRLERLPLGSNVVYPPDSLPALRNVDAAIAQALREPVGIEPLSELLHAGHAADDRVRRHLAAAAADADPGHSSAGDRAGSRAGRGPRRRRRRVDRRELIAPADDACGASTDRRRPGFSVLLPRPPAQPRRRGHREPGRSRYDDPGRGRRAEPTGDGERSRRLREHHAHRDEWRAEVGFCRTGELSKPAAPPQRPHPAAFTVLQRPAQLGDAPLLRADAGSDRRPGHRLPDRGDPQQRHVPGLDRLPQQARVGVEPSRPGPISGGQAGERIAADEVAAPAMAGHGCALWRDRRQRGPTG